ncbi:uncharacterized protein LOC110467351 [Mizuhopecten yessoensis]|uniref:THD domain-containing protein n=1 Tax=Mizuhopecten yessoensis TaxID=6573 RepID=A0A210R1A3_MIZYE|nr:uncharacterized protein LOC110467351 [Mizuhopecten yessoensis]OWF54833.1 hypothetical protein KP79_PYT20819 [Mizuhopecten yessoensis]
MAALENEYADMLGANRDKPADQRFDKVWKNGFILTVVANILALSSLVFLHVYSQVVEHGEPDLDSLLLSEDLCIPCQEETALFDYRVKTQSGKHLCCYNNTDIQRAVKLMLKEERRFNTEFNDGQNYKPRDFKLETKEDLSWWKSRPSAAHLHLDTTASNLTRMRWRHHSDFVTSFVSEGIKVINGTKIQVSDRGMYFIYSTISVEFSKLSKGQPNTGKSFYHNIQKSNSKLPKTGATIQMMRKYGGVPDKETDKLYTSFLCGALFLKDGDQLASVFDTPPLIYKFPYANYFGIFKL